VGTDDCPLAELEATLERPLRVVFCRRRLCSSHTACQLKHLLNPFCSRAAAPNKTMPQCPYACTYDYVHACVYDSTCGMVPRARQRVSGAYTMRVDSWKSPILKGVSSGCCLPSVKDGAWASLSAG
jgi:hypothetical protein